MFFRDIQIDTPVAEEENLNLAGVACGRGRALAVATVHAVGTPQQIRNLLEAKWYIGKSTVGLPFQQGLIQRHTALLLGGRKFYVGLGFQNLGLWLGLWFAFLGGFLLCENRCYRHDKNQCYG